MNQTLTPGRKRALARAVEKAQLNHLIYLSTPPGGETRQQRRTRERVTAKTIRHLQKEQSRHGNKAETGETQKEIRQSAEGRIIDSPRQEGDQG